MTEVAINTPFDANEVKEILTQEFRKRLDQLVPLQGGKEYSSFSATYNTNITLRRGGETTTPKETLAWGQVEGGKTDPEHEADTSTSVSSFESKYPNAEREDRGMAMTVESGDGRGGKLRRKVNVKQ